MATRGPFVLEVPGHTFHFELQDVGGPYVLGKGGHPLADQPGPRSLFWEAYWHWDRQGRQVDDQGRCIFKWETALVKITEQAGRKLVVKTPARPELTALPTKAPAWAGEITVPGTNVRDNQIAELMRRGEELAVQITALKNDRDQLLRYVQLLFGCGKAVLQPVVRTALRTLGFSVPEPEEYQGEWDVELREVQSGQKAIGEVEASQGFVDVGKYQQLLGFIEAEALEGREHKGILIGNGFRFLPPEAPERQNQFSDHALRGAARNQFCLLPTTELFKALCAVLESPDDEVLKGRIRESLLTTVGPWHYQESSSGLRPQRG